MPLRYWQEYKYSAQHILEYACFTNQPERAEKAFAYFSQKTNADIDLSLRFYQTAWFWFETARAERLAREVFPSVFANSAQFWGDPHHTFGKAISMC